MAIKVSGTTVIDNSRNLSLDSMTFSGSITSTLANGSAPVSVASTTKVTNLNAGYLNSQLGSYYKDAPTSSKTVFFQAAAPTGWTQDTTNTDRMLRLVSGTGAGTGGSDSPISMTVVPSHSHDYTSGGASADHTHTVNATSAVESQGHTHSGPFFGSSYQYTLASGSYSVGYSSPLGAEQGNHTHNVNGNTYGNSATHSHSYTSDNGSSQTNWSPYYINIIVCTRDAST